MRMITHKGCELETLAIIIFPLNICLQVLWKRKDLSFWGPEDISSSETLSCYWCEWFNIRKVGNRTEVTLSTVQENEYTKETLHSQETHSTEQGPVDHTGQILCLEKSSVPLVLKLEWWELNPDLITALWVIEPPALTCSGWSLAWAEWIVLTSCNFPNNKAKSPGVQGWLYDLRPSYVPEDAKY